MIASNLSVRIELLSDLHIGTGTELKKNLDWIAPGDGWIYVADGNRLMETIFARAEADGQAMVEIADILAGGTLDDLYEMGWLTAEDFGREHPLFRYRLHGDPATVNIREQIKDVYGRPYLPGSSLKGALRTALAIQAAKALKPDLTKLHNSRSWAAQPVERQLFGADPNHDLLRALQVADSAPVSPKQLRLQRAHIYPTAGRTQRGRSRGLDIDVETLGKGTVLETSIHVPTELLTERNTAFDERRRSELGHWERSSGWFADLAAAGREQARQILTDEVTFFQDRSDVRAVHYFYHQVVERFTGLQPNEMILVLGWGGGWHTKTLNQLLKADPSSFERIVSKYRLNPTGTHRPGDPFPKSRHLLRRSDGQPGDALGWCLVALEEES